MTNTSFGKTFTKTMTIAMAITFALGLVFISTPSIAAEQATFDYSKYPFSVQDELTRSECGDCHMVFSAGRLTMNGWKKIMSTLDDHFGEDATIDSADAKHIEKYLVSKAFDAKNSVPSRMRIKQWKKKGLIDPIRITVTPNWTRHHKSKKYKLMTVEVKYDRGSNCIICHKNGEKGVYEEFPGLYGIK